jgi:hypothetical protein
VQPYARGSDLAVRPAPRTLPGHHPPDLKPANSMITRSRVARIFPEPGGISQPSGLVTDRAGIVCSRCAQNDAIVEKQMRGAEPPR